ncbi:aminopeptidase P family protein [Pseudomonas sp. CDFA 553]|uniref:M24 family metallopeptidase n=1 Tax=Pseudomonas quasicaspiana TaxID=2829821 RepID=UPI001E5428F6|nr:Xaa-Pro peptidase family protein [Pseudomonas quasicaspiana]MCD5987200.1 aminopeptidase P family protein [Pseudomonas quasicaspiana]
MKNHYINQDAADQPLKDPVSSEDLNTARIYRLQRVRDVLAASECTAILLYDPVNIRYATDSSNMQVWTGRNPSRYAVVFASGPIVLWEFHNCNHLSAHLDCITEFRPAVNWAYFGSGPRLNEKASQWAAEIADLVKLYGGKNCRLAVDRLEPEGRYYLAGHGIEVIQGQALMETARAVKSPEELKLMKWTISVCERGIQRMYDELRPGMTENELWAWLHFENVRHGGEWIETRLLASGPRTNPWMQESSDKVMQEGEIVAFDTDLIGPYGYCADISRAWTVGHVPPTPEQKRLYRAAHEQIHHNLGLLKAGISFREFSDHAWRIPEEFFNNRYNCLAHGVGMVDEYPAIAHAGNDWVSGGYDGVFLENMVVCVESCVGAEGGKEGVKLEQQVLITRDGCVPLSAYPFEDSWLAQ